MGAVMYPVLISSVGIFVGVLTLLLYAACYPVKEMQSVEKALKGILNISTVVMTPVVVTLSFYCLPADFGLAKRGDPSRGRGSFSGVGGPPPTQTFRTDAPPVHTLSVGTYTHMAPEVL